MQDPGVNTLKKLFENNGEIMSISSVKEQSQKSEFINSKSDIGNFLRNQGKAIPDIFDDYVDQGSSRVKEKEKQKEKEKEKDK